MKLKKPDRFVRMVQRRFPNWQKFLKGDPMLSWGQAAELLRQEHAWMRRMIKKQYKNGADIGSVNYGYNQAVEFFLEQLDQRRK